MANLKLKDISNLGEWNEKELRKLKMLVKNRIHSFENSAKQAELKKNHPLYKMDDFECKSLLENILTAQRKLKIQQD
ncbi:MAG: hypothetical protein A2202_08905 [Bdellovibrionales bacterium RIFOXYA1_FULL_36_14]|nr:MAG: hypothetical protein A2202_08905 [Bdellovibrionales bacterium RIFOXYA1_FULL_36_14]